MYESSLIYMLNNDKLIQMFFIKMLQTSTYCKPLLMSVWRVHCALCTDLVQVRGETFMKTSEVPQSLKGGLTVALLQYTWNEYTFRNISL